jgi:hypothetical protein
MGSEPHEFEALCVRLSIDQNEIRPDVAIAKIFPLAGKHVIEVAPRQPLVVREEPHRFGKVSVEAAPIPTGFLSPIIAPELSGVPNTPH